MVRRHLRVPCLQRRARGVHDYGNDGTGVCENTMDPARARRPSPHLPPPRVVRGSDGAAARHELGRVQRGSLRVDGRQHDGAHGSDVPGPVLLGRVLRDACGAGDAVPEVQRRPDRVALRGAVHHAEGELHGVSFPLSSVGVGGGCLFPEPHRVRVIHPLSSLSVFHTLVKRQFSAAQAPGRDHMWLLPALGHIPAVGGMQPERARGRGVPSQPDLEEVDHPGEAAARGGDGRGGTPRTRGLPGIAPCGRGRGRGGRRRRYLTPNLRSE